jgi:hypothetical protein
MNICLLAFVDTGGRCWWLGCVKGLILVESDGYRRTIFAYEERPRRFELLFGRGSVGSQVDNVLVSATNGATGERQTLNSGLEKTSGTGKNKIVWQAGGCVCWDAWGLRT